jgi:hypothetical protein
MAFTVEPRVENSGNLPMKFAVFVLGAETLQGRYCANSATPQFTAALKLNICFSLEMALAVDRNT